MMKSLSRMVAAAGLLALGLAAVPASASGGLNKERAGQFVDKLAQRAISEIATADISQQERIERFRTLLRQGFNVPLISRLVLGRYWRRADESTRDRFADVFEKFTVYRYAGLFDKYKGQELSVVGVSEDGRNGAMVTSRVKQPQGEAVRVRWRLRPASGDAAGSGDGDAEAAGQETDRPKGLTVEGDGPRWKVVDIVVEGVSMIVTQRDEFGSIARRQGVDGLIKALKNKVAQFRQDGPPDPPEVVKQGEG